LNPRCVGPILGEKPCGVGAPAGSRRRRAPCPEGRLWPPGDSPAAAGRARCAQRPASNALRARRQERTIAYFTLESPWRRCSAVAGVGRFDSPPLVCSDAIVGRMRAPAKLSDRTPDARRRFSPSPNSRCRAIGQPCRRFQLKERDGTRSPLLEVARPARDLLPQALAIASADRTSRAGLRTAQLRLHAAALGQQASNAGWHRKARPSPAGTACRRSTLDVCDSRASSSAGAPCGHVS